MDVMKNSARPRLLPVMLALTGLATAGCPGSSDFAQKSWRGLWPQDSREEAERAQEAADGGDERYRWQLSADGAQVALRFVRQELGWENFEGFDLSARGEVRRHRLIRCAAGSNPDYPNIDCAPGKDRGYPAVYVTLERFLRKDEAGIWIVSHVAPTEVAQPEPASVGVVRKMVSMFMTRRISGRGAEEFLSREGRREFGRANPLYSPAEGSPNADYEIVFVGGPLWPYGTFEVGVRMILESGASVEDTLFVGPGRNVHGEKKVLVVHGFRPGLEGP